eukprot:4140196-Pyramimonas_sp.AAC.1
MRLGQIPPGTACARAARGCETSRAQDVPLYMEGRSAPGRWASGAGARVGRRAATHPTNSIATLL